MDIRKNLFTERMASQSYRLARTVVEKLFLEVFKSHDVLLRTWVSGMSGSFNVWT